MFGSEVLEVGIGIVFLFLLISLICTAARELLEAVMKTRAADLERGIRELLHDRKGTGITIDFYRHPLIYSLFAEDYKPPVATSDGTQQTRTFRERRRLPSYIPAGSFASAILDIVARGKDPGASATGGEALTIDSLRRTITKIDNPYLQRAILTALDTSNGNVNAARASMEAWFNASMDRVSGWYKRRTQVILFGLGFAAAAVLNIDTITVTQRLSRDKTLRDAIVAQAEAWAQTNRDVPAPAPPDPAVPAADGIAQVRERLAGMTEQLNAVGYPIGWAYCEVSPAPAAAEPQKMSWFITPAPQSQAANPNHTKGACGPNGLGFSWILVPIGWLVTAFAVMLGAPFWFDILNKFMVIRSTVKPNEKSLPEGSEDRQPVRPPTARIEVVAGHGGGGGAVS